MPEQITTNPFNRPPRIQEHFSPHEIEIPAPPAEQDSTTPGLLMMLLPVSSILVMGLFYLLLYSGTPGTSGALFAIPMLGIGVFTVLITLLTTVHQKHEAKLRHLRQLRDYHRLLDKKESRLVSARELQLSLLFERFPSPQRLRRKALDLDLHLWERRPEDPDFMAVRLGLGLPASQLVVRPPDPDLNSPDIRRAFGIYTAYRNLPEAPVVLSLLQVGSFGIVGPRPQALAFVYSLLLQLTAFHSPEDLHLYLLSQEYRYPAWQWMRWLPHVSAKGEGASPDFLAFGQESCRRKITEISARLVHRSSAPEKSEDENESQPAPQQRSKGPFLLTIIDGQVGVQDEPGYSSLIREGRALSTCTILLCEKLEDIPSDCEGVLRLDGSHFRFSQVGSRGLRLEGDPDYLKLAQADSYARKLIPITVKSLGQTGRIPSRVNLLQLYGVEQIRELNIRDRWTYYPEDGLLPFPAPIGSESLSKSLWINLAENHDGPHGIIAGTTGSGKSELLQTLVSALAIENHPYFVSFLLVDFKGDSTFGVFKELPHRVGSVTNLDTSAALRALEAIRAENLRRQRFLSELKIEDITDYHLIISREGGIPPGWEPLPHLFIIVDEFAQLAKDLPNFLPELVATVRVGRSLGMHLVLATQRPAGVVNDEMRANLNFRISLRVQTMDDSRDMLRRPDAALLPADLPGRAYFQLGDGGSARQFQAARVGTGYVEDEEHPQNAQPEQERILYLVDLEERRSLFDEQQAKKKKQLRMLSAALVAEMNQLYAAMCEKEGLRPLDPILLPPLEKKILLPALLEGRQGGWDAEQKCWSPLDLVELCRQGMLVSVGQVDELETRQQPPLRVDLFKHLAIFGGTGMGKTVFLRTLALSAAHQYSPDLLHFYVLSFAGKGLDMLKDLPHTGDVVHSGETERLNRLIRHLAEQFEERKELLGNAQADDLAQYNAQNQNSPLPLITVMIDNFAELRDASYDAELFELEKLIRDGRAFGIVFFMTAMQSATIPFKIMNLVDQRLVLYLTDRTEYAQLLGRNPTLEVASVPGRGLVLDSVFHEFQLALPLAADPDAESPAALPASAGLEAAGAVPALAAGNGLKTQTYFQEIAREMSRAWKDSGCKLPREISFLPLRVSLQQLLPDVISQPAPAQADVSFPVRSVIGKDGSTLSAAVLDWSSAGPHFLVCGPPGSGRTSLLLSSIASAALRWSPEQLWIVLVDSSQESLKPLRHLPHVISWVNDEDGLAENIAHLKKELSWRKEQLKEREYWGEPRPLSFPAIAFVFDDYDLTLEAMEVNPRILTQLGKHVRQDSRLGFHLWLGSVIQSLGNSSDPLIRQIKLARSGMALSTAEAVDALGGRTTASMHKETLPEGRGYLLVRSSLRLIQFAYPDPASLEKAGELWKDCGFASWLHPASLEEIEAVKRDAAPDESGGDGYSQGGGDWLSVDEDMVAEYLRLREEERRSQKNQEGDRR